MLLFSRVSKSPARLQPSLLKSFRVSGVCLRGFSPNKEEQEVLGQIFIVRC